VTCSPGGPLLDLERLVPPREIVVEGRHRSERQLRNTLQAGVRPGAEAASHQHLAADEPVAVGPAIRTDLADSIILGVGRAAGRAYRGDQSNLALKGHAS